MRTTYLSKNLQINEIEINKGQIYGLPKNPRFIRDERFAALKKSIEDAPEMLGLRELLVYPHEGKYVVIGGNMRLRACLDLGYKEIPCKVLPQETPVAKLREYTIKDNEAFGQNDWDILANEWNDEELQGWGVELPDDWGTNGGEILGVENIVEDDAPDEVEHICEVGDVWKLGEHRLICGDCTDKGVLDILMKGNKADLYITDPPYNVNYEGGTKDKLKIANDNLSDDKFRQFLNEAFSCANSVMRAGAVFYIWHADSEGYNFRGACRDNGWVVRECLIWNKNSLVLGRQDYQWKHEPCLYGWKDGAPHLWASDRKQVTVLNFDRPTRSAEHPTMKPVSLFAYQISNNTHEGDIVLDSFGGSGTTLIACEQLKRKCYMAELAPHYCDVIIRRWENLTGLKAERVLDK